MTTRQEVLEVITKGAGLRSEAVGWTLASGVSAHQVMLEQGLTCHVGFIGSPRVWYAYPTVLHALGDGWKLLAPPRDCVEYGQPFYEWWLVRDAELNHE